MTNDGFGDALALSGSILVIGGFAHASSSGRAYVFAKTAAGWQQRAELKGFDTVANDEFGYGVDVSGDTVVVGAPYHAAHAGSAYLFEA